MGICPIMSGNVVAAEKNGVNMTEYRYQFNSVPCREEDCQLWVREALGKIKPSEALKDTVASLTVKIPGHCGLRGGKQFGN